MDIAGYVDHADAKRSCDNDLPLAGRGNHSRSIRVQGHFTDRDESCLIDGQFADYSMLIWCEHWGAMLACYKWLVDLAAQGYRLDVATAANEYLDELLYDTGPDTQTAS